jgi:hypothetical protein
VLKIAEMNGSFLSTYTVHFLSHHQERKETKFIAEEKKSSDKKLKKLSTVEKLFGK